MYRNYPGCRVYKKKYLSECLHYFSVEEYTDWLWSQNTGEKYHSTGDGVNYGTDAYHKPHKTVSTSKIENLNRKTVTSENVYNKNVNKFIINKTS